MKDGRGINNRTYIVTGTLGFSSVIFAQNRYSPHRLLTESKRGWGKNFRKHSGTNKHRRNGTNSTRQKGTCGKCRVVAFK